MAAKFIMMAVAAIVMLSDVQSREIRSQDEMRGKCQSETGLSRSEIASVISRNENCAFDCTTKQGTVQTFYAKEGTECHDSEGYECILGKCRASKEASIVQFGDLWSLEIRVIEAHVADLDVLPSTGHSDVFVNIEVTSGAKPSYDDGELVCHTYTVLDNGNPKWRNFLCKTLPMKKSAMLKFTAWDSDKPVVLPELLGSAEESVEYLLNRGETVLSLRGNKGEGDITVEVTGTRYKRDEE